MIAILGFLGLWKAAQETSEPGAALSGRVMGAGTKGAGVAVGGGEAGGPKDIWRWSWWDCGWGEEVGRANEAAWVLSA